MGTANSSTTVEDKTSFKDFKGFPSALPSYAEDDKPAPLSLRELDCMLLSNLIREKPEWQRKVYDKSITDKWIQECRERAEELPSETPPTDAMVEYVLDEVKWIASQVGDDGIQVAVDNTYRSDTLVSADIQDELKALAHKLETEQPLDWHPNSDEKVLDLLHPSLFPLQYNVTRILDPESRPLLKAPCLSQSGGGTVVTVNKEWQKKRALAGLWSPHFQWLPADFQVKPDGTVSIDSYINNLHPVDYAPFYKSIARLFEKFVPMFETTLRSLLYPRPERMIVDCDWYNMEDEPHVDWKTEDPELRAAQDAAYEEWYDNREPIIPDVEKFDPADMEPWKNEDKPKKKTVPRTWRREKPVEKEKFPSYKLSDYEHIQVIVKMANIHLTPEKPEYGGGAWHLEGQMNESIISTGIYYYDSDNITESRLYFRQACHEPNYEQNDNKGVQAVYGLEDEDDLSQRLGFINTITGRAICFPNVYQHKVAPFKLADSTKKGHRKIIAFFLIDPFRKAISTSSVPPQQKSWWSSKLREIPKFSRLPGEIFDMIVDKVSYPLSFEDACDARAKLMEERSNFAVQKNEDIFEYKFSLCEH